jgi:HK97 family phage major capsid protein
MRGRTRDEAGNAQQDLVRFFSKEQQMNLKTMREQRAKAIADARAILDRAETEKRGLSAEEITTQNAFLADARRIGETIRNAEEIEAEERGAIPETQRTEQRGAASRENGNTEQRAAYLAAFDKYLRVGMGELSGDEQRAIRQGYVAFNDGDEKRSMNTATGAAGGFSVATDTSMYGKVIEGLKFFGGVETAVRTCGGAPFETQTGASLPFALDNDTANAGVLVAEEGAQTGGTDVALSQKTMGAYLFSTKIVLISWQLLQDASIDVAAYLGRKFGVRLGRVQNTYFTTGTGTSQPQGVATAAAIGRTAVAGNTTTIPADDIKRTKYSVDVAYRGNSAWMMNDSSALTLALLKDTTNQYIWQQSMQAGQPDRLEGSPVVINNDIAAMGVSAKSILYGDFSYYAIRRVLGVQVVRLNELYAGNGQVGFIGFMRADGALLDPGSNPVKAFQNSAT